MTANPAPALLRLPDVTRRTGLSRATIYRRIAASEFPAPRTLGPRMVAWREADVSAWIEARPEHQPGHIAPPPPKNRAPSTP